MKKILLVCALFVFACSASFAANSASYRVDNASIDAIMSNAVEVSAVNAALPLDIQGTGAVLQSAKNPWIAFALSWVVGWCGVHRMYLGSKGSMWAIYLFTCGGIFGIVNFVDWIVLLIGGINNDIASFVDNEKFFMWAN